MVYLGSMFSRDGKYEIDTKMRIAAGNRVRGALAAFMIRRYVSTATRLAVHNAVLVTTLLYGSETWVGSLRRICGVSLADRIRNDEIHRISKNEEERAQLV